MNIHSSVVSNAKAEAEAAEAAFAARQQTPVYGWLQEKFEALCCMAECYATNPNRDERTLLALEERARGVQRAMEWFMRAASDRVEEAAHALRAARRAEEEERDPHGLKFLVSLTGYEEPGKLGLPTYNDD